MFSLFYDRFFEIIFQILAVIEARIIFSFQSLVKQMFFGIAETVSIGVLQERSFNL